MVVLFVDFFSLVLFLLFTVFRPETFFSFFFFVRSGPSAKIQLFFEYNIVRKMFCKNFDDDIRNKHLKMESWRLVRFRVRFVCSSL